MDADDAEVAAYAEAARQADIVIAEVGIWNNPLHSDDAERKAAIEMCKRALDLADRIGARCAVNLGGTPNPERNCPDPRNLTEDTLGAIVDTVREVLRAVKPLTARYAIETMPWMWPDSADAALKLVDAIDEPMFGIHFDPVNLMTNPRALFCSGGIVRDFIDRLGPHIAAVHVKDAVVENRLTVHIEEVRLGLGSFDLGALIEASRGLGPDTPFLLEHLGSEADYRLAEEHFRGVAASLQPVRNP